MSGAVERWTARSGPRIRFLDNDPEDPMGCPVLFVPGLSDVADEYLELLDAFLPRRALVVEVRGRGGNEAPPSGYTAADHAADLRAVLAEAGIGRVHLMTFSRGTTWALQLALDEPSRIASLAIGDYRAAEIGLPPEFVDAQWAGTFRGRPMPERLPRHVLEAVIGESRTRPLWEALAAFPFPLLVARPGGTGGILTDDDIARYRGARPDVEIVVVPDAPHDLFRHDRRFYARAVADFIARRAGGD